MEDDVEFLEDINQISYFLKKLSEINNQWDIFYTDVDFRNESGSYTRALATDSRPDQALFPLSYYIEKIPIASDIMQVRNRYGTHSIILSKKGIEKILHYFTHVYLWTAIDIDLHYISGIQEYSPMKDIVTNLRDGSDSDNIKDPSFALEN